MGSVATAVVVTASRAERDTKQIPLHVDTITQAAVEQTNQTSTGDALTMAANITPVGNGPFGVRPRLRGLDSTRLLVLVDGERLNTARQATDRTGAEVGLVSPDAISRMEVVNGAGTLMYGSDALAGTINIITNESSLHAARSQLLYGFNGFYSSNENGMRGTGTVGVTAPTLHPARAGRRRGLRQLQGRRPRRRRTRSPYFDAGVLDQADTIDDNFGFNFDAFPEPFNAPYVRTDNEVLNSQAQRQLRQRVEPDQGRRPALGARALPAPPHGGRRLPGLRRSRTSSTRRRCRTATSIACRPATRRRRSRRGSPTCR